MARNFILLGVVAMRIDRMLSIVIMLLNRERISARELADKFEVNIRTIYRDIDAINLAGIPVISYPGNSGGFAIMSNFRLERQLLSLSDLSSILAALKSINSSLENTQIDTAIEKLQNLVPSHERGYFSDSFEQIAIDLIPWGITARVKENLKTLYGAITENRLIDITYRVPGKDTEKRTVEPMTLLVKGFAWYIFAFCRNRNAFRIFKLSRIRTIDFRKDCFNRRNESYRNHISALPEMNRETTPVTLRFNPNIREHIEEAWDESMFSVNTDGSIDLTMNYPDDDWLESMILSYGSDVEVLSPDSLRKKVARKAELMAAIYRKTDDELFRKE